MGRWLWRAARCLDISFCGCVWERPSFFVSQPSVRTLRPNEAFFLFFAPEPFQSHKLSSLSHWQPELDNERIAYSGRTNRRKLHCVCSVSAASLQTRVLSLLVLKCAAKTLFSLHKSCPHSRGEIYIKKDYSFSKRSSSSSTVGGKMFASHAHSREHSYVGKPFLCGEKKLFFSRTHHIRSEENWGFPIFTTAYIESAAAAWRRKKWKTHDAITPYAFFFFSAN